MMSEAHGSILLSHVLLNGTIISTAVLGLISSSKLLQRAQQICLGQATHVMLLVRPRTADIICLLVDLYNKNSFGE